MSENTENQIQDEANEADFIAAQAASEEFVSPSAIPSPLRLKKKQLLNPSSVTSRSRPWVVVSAPLFAS